MFFQISDGGDKEEDVPDLAVNAQTIMMILMLLMVVMMLRMNLLPVMTNLPMSR